MPRNNEGGPAFPVFSENTLSGRIPGMTMRQWYKGQAIIAIAGRMIMQYSHREIVYKAASLADIMVEEDERSRKG